MIKTITIISLVLAIPIFTLFLLCQRVRDDKNKPIKALGFWFGPPIGFLCGFFIGVYVSPPFEGIWESSADVKGLTVISWVVFGFMFALLGLVVGPIIYWVINKFGRKNRITA